MTCPRCQAENRDGARFCREAAAAALYREMGMGFWLEKMETASPPAREASRP